MRECCLRESREQLRKHRDVATCDVCGALLLAYGNEIDFRRTVAELERRNADYDTHRRDSLYLVAKYS